MQVFEGLPRHVKPVDEARLFRISMPSFCKRVHQGTILDTKPGDSLCVDENKLKTYLEDRASVRIRKERSHQNDKS